MLVVHSLTRFEEYLKDLFYDLCLFSSVSIIYKGNQILHNKVFCASTPPEKDIVVSDQIDGLLWNLKTKNIIPEFLRLLSKTDNTLTQLLPLYHYFRVGRNCIVHSNGITNTEFVNQINNPDLNTSYTFWNSICTGNAHQLKTFRKNEKIQFEMVDAILASAVCRKIAEIMNTLAVQKMNPDGFIYMATYYGIIVDEHDYRMKTKDAANLIRHFLYTQYGNNSINKMDIIQYLRHENIYDEVKKRFTAIQLNL